MKTCFFWLSITEKADRGFAVLLGTCPKAYRPTKKRINSLWPMGKVLYSRHHMIGIEYRICCGLAGLAFMCNNPFLCVFLLMCLSET